MTDWQTWEGEIDPADNIGLATGARSGVVVLDLDKKPGKDGIASLSAIGKLPKTRTVRTGSGGLHLYFKHPGGHVPNSAGKIGLGVDTRGDGGYVLVPPSNHLSGNRYELIADLPPADLPEWLAMRMAPRDEAPTIPVERGFFPAASQAILDQAAAALERHGPAIQGQGGDLHTFRAGAILTHDFALTDDEAWPLLVEWNADCQPPWSERELRAKLRGGEKYGSAEYGCKRTAEAWEASQRCMTKWRENPDPATMAQMVDEVGKIARHAHPVTRALIERDLTALTGLKPKELDLPDPAPDLSSMGDDAIEVNTAIAELADKSTRAIAKLVFQRNGILCEVVTSGQTYIHELAPAGIQDKMSQSAKFYRVDKSGPVLQTAPLAVATVLHSRRGHKGIRILDAITTSPIFLTDGSILNTAGYNEQARVYLDPSVTVDVPDAPTHADARAAIGVLADLVCDFKFQDRADRSAWIAALLSPLVKAATRNAPSPLFCVSASSPGAGKSMLADLISVIVTGQRAEMRPYAPKDPAEWGKKLTAFVRMASPVSVFDNANGMIGDDALNRLITSSTWSDRLLGVSDAPPMPIVSTWIATGNNIEPIEDTIRRALFIRIEVDSERPQERSDFKRPLLIDYALENRGTLLSAALTVLRAFHVAKRPTQALPAWGSFTVWSDLIRGALVWTGLADPFLTQRRVSADLGEPENDAHDFWIGVIDASDGSPAAICGLANQREAQSTLGIRESITPVFLRRFVNRFVDKPRQGKRIRRAGGRYWVEKIT